MPRHSLVLSNRQQLSISPRLQQAVRLLQMSALEFQQELQQQLADNPFLEESEDEPGLPEGLEAAAANPPDPLEPSASSDGDDEAPSIELLDYDDTAAALPEAAGHDGDGSDGSSGGDAHGDASQWLSNATTLRSHLREQLGGARLGPREVLVAGLVIETLDDDGYLRDDPAATASAMGIVDPPDAAAIAEGIRIVQQFDPVGIAARSLSECLRLQLQAIDRATPGRALALRLVDDHLSLLGRHDYTSLRRRLDCSAAALQQAHGLIRRLDPKPGERYTAPPTDYVEPDVLVIEHHGQLMTLINPAVLPRARLNRGCIDLMRQVQSSRHPAMQAQLQEARWLLRNAAQRHLTIRRVAEVIVRRQRGFFQYGNAAMRPLIQREVADELGLHESTLSRATANKFMATPRGTYEFRHFFSRELQTRTGGTCSAAAVRELIRDLITSESPESPLSDVRLAELLTGSGICVARRTVAKYRNQLKLPAWELRHLP